MSEMKTNTASAMTMEELKEFKGRSMAQETWRRLLKNKGAIVGMIFMILLVVIACAGDIIYDYETDVIGFSADLSQGPS